jgi:hypothetical protein
LIRHGKVIWATAWTPEQVAAGRHNEEEQRRAYYDALGHKQHELLRRFWNWVKSLFE